MLTGKQFIAEFDYLRPTTLQEAVEFLVAHNGTARPFMGGTDLFVRLRDGFYPNTRYVVDLKGLPGMLDISFDPAAGLRLGAAVNMNRVAAHPAVQAHYPILAQAARAVASYQLRNRATVAGNLCNGSPASDTAPACLAIGATAALYGPAGERRLPLNPEVGPHRANHGFFTGPGKTQMQPGEIVTAIEIPPPAAGWAGRYLKLGRNRAGDLAIVGVAALGFPDASAASGYRFRVALASVAPTPLRATTAEAILAQGPLTEATISAAAEAAMDAATPISDARASAEYRKLMVRNLTRRAVKDVLARMGV
ncbi:MAG: FAD binding domain-containing protein [Chloroflexota bacterium]